MGLELSGQVLPDSRVVDTMVGTNLLEYTSPLDLFLGMYGGALPFRTGELLWARQCKAGEESRDKQI
eukprot:1141653-Pelagomonas_calceolata.AAC.2